MEKKLLGKIVYITGASKGIGRGIAREFGKAGAFVLVGYNSDLEGANETLNMIKELGGSGEILGGNVANKDERNNIISSIKNKFGKLDVLVNNAGITKDGLILRMKDQDFDDVLNVNLKGTFNTTKFVSQVMFKQKHGKIVNISSVVGLIGNAGQSNYSASKAGVIGFSKSVAKELASRNININVVAPGYIDTDMTKSLPDRVKEEILKSIPMKKIGNPKEVANLVLFLSSNLSDYITGQVINVDGGMVMA